MRLATEQLGALVAEERRHLAVGAFPSAIATIVPTALVRMGAAEPHVEVNVSEGRLDELVAAVRDGTLHLAVLFQDAAAPRRDHEDCVAAGFEPNIAFVTRDVLAFRELVASGLAVTLTGRLLAELANPASDTRAHERAQLSGERATECGPVSRPAVRREHDLDRQIEQHL